MKSGIDVSKWQGTIDWKAVKSSGIDFAIIKAGGVSEYTDELYSDSYFETNYKNAKAAGMPIGCYFIPGRNFLSNEEATKDAKYFCELIKSKTFEYPVVLDIEMQPANNKARVTEAAITFCKFMESKGYYVSIYASDLSGFQSRLDLNKLKDFDKWVARYGSKPQYVKTYGMWQKSDSGNVDGISGRVDLDEAYKDYPTLIKEKGLNGFSKNQNGSKPSKPDIDQIAKDVIKGKYGNGEERKKALGDIYDEVQAKVNDLLCQPKVDIDQIAKDVIKGKYGNGEERKKALGDIYDDVQKRVNELLK